jgi:enoyl-CoA hydratase
MDTTPEYRDILLERLGPVLRISHNRAHVRNAESVALLQELDDALHRAKTDEDVRVVIFAGKGDHFSAGHDIKEAQKRPGLPTVEQRWDFEQSIYFDTALRIWDFPKPTIAQVQGACIGGAFMVANMCDLLVASTDAYFADPVCHSLAAAAVEVLIHPWVMGLRQAKDMLYTGRRVGAQEAMQMGMVNKLVDRKELEESALELARRIAEAPPFALRLVKRSLNRSLDAQGFRSALDSHFDTHQLSHQTEEYRSLATGRDLEGAIGRAKRLT